MIRCQDFADFLCSFICRELPGDLQAEVQEHLVFCWQCRAELEQYERVMRLAGQLPDLAPPHSLLLRFRAWLKEHPHGLGSC